MSGRGLGHTGGTLDKLESIPGFDVELSIDAFVQQVREVGLAIVGQTADLVPADKQLYGLRDVTGTVDIVPLIASSIMSKKIAGGADAVVLDVKVGDGAFMKTLEDAHVLAESMLELGRRAEREVVCLLTDMDQPLGRRSRERAGDPRGARHRARRGPAGLHRARARRVRAHARVLRSRHRRRRGAAPRGGRRRRRLRAASSTSGGSRRRAVIRIRSRCRGAAVVREVEAPRAGAVTRLGAIQIGQAALHLGAGRRAKEDSIDHAVGIVCRVKRGEQVDAGDVLAEVHAQEDAAADEAVREVLAAYELGDEPPPERSILLDVVGQ